MVSEHLKGTGNAEGPTGVHHSHGDAQVLVDGNPALDQRVAQDRQLDSAADKAFHAMGACRRSTGMIERSRDQPNEGERGVNWKGGGSEWTSPERCSIREWR